MSFGMREFPDSPNPQEVIEKELQFLGFSLIEDILQENVQKCIIDFKEAGMKVFMITGDKIETSISIA